MGALPQLLPESQTPKSLQIVSDANSVRYLARLDRVGAGLSFACAIHCLALPFVLTVLPVLGLSFLADSIFEVFALVGALLFSSISLWWGHKVHQETSLFWFLGIGAALFALAHSLESADGAGHDHLVHSVMMGLGGLSLAIGHVVNRRLCRSCETCQDHAPNSPCCDH